MPPSNIDRLIEAGELLRPVLDELVFVGGAVTSLLVTDEGAGHPRTTLDVDAIAEITSYSEYSAFGERLRSLGFSEDTREGAPLCRWVQAAVTLDVMPLDEKVLGFSNRWYPKAIESAVRYELQEGLTLRVVGAPYFLATKIEAFRGRGKGDFFASHDLEDVIFVVGGRAAIVEEVRAAEQSLQEYLQTQVGSLIATPAFLDALPGYLLPDPASQARLETVLRQLQGLAVL